MGKINRTDAKIYLDLDETTAQLTRMNHRTKSRLAAAASVAVSLAFLAYALSGRPGYESAALAFIVFFATHTFESVCSLFDR